MQFGKYPDNIFDGVLTEKSFSFAENTTYGLGGRAKAAFFPDSAEQAIAVFDYLKKSGEKFVVMGCGSNVLAADGNYDGYVISTKLLKGIYSDGDYLYCESGVTVAALMKFCLNSGLGGYEYLAGIPATVGGLALMNGGIPQRHIGEDILSVDYFDGQRYEILNKSCNFGNKYSTMRDINGLILGLKLSKYAVNRETSIQNLSYFIEKRKNQPHGKSCGCVFKNPTGGSAGKLIDCAGLKGLRCGGAFVSEKHANFIINGGGTACDVFKLIRTVKNKVYERFGVMLEEEVVYIGEFNETDC